MAGKMKKSDIQMTDEAKRKALEKGGNVADVDRPSTATGTRALRIAASTQGAKGALKQANNSNTSRKKTGRAVEKGAKKGSKTKIRRAA